MDQQAVALWEFFGIFWVPILGTIATLIYRYYTDDLIYRGDTEKRATHHGWGVYGSEQTAQQPTKKAPAKQAPTCDHECFGYYCGVHKFDPAR